MCAMFNLQVLLLMRKHNLSTIETITILSQLVGQLSLVEHIDTGISTETISIIVSDNIEIGMVKGLEAIKEYAPVN